jgi:lysozyme family protein
MKRNNMSFEVAVERLLRHEGGYSNDPRDNGGETYKGVSRRWFPKWRGWDINDRSNKLNLDHNHQLQQEVKNFYYAYFWVPIRAYEVENDFIADMLFNFAVNMGKKVIVKKTQRILRVTQDGVIGPKTIQALNSINQEVFVYHFLLEIMEFYIQLGKKQPHYLRGWLNRAVSFYYEYERLV